MEAEPLTPEGFAARTNVSRETLAHLSAYAETLIRFQRTVNLVGRATLGDLWRRHFLDSAQIFNLLPPMPQHLTLLDVGSGAGFPGLVLAIMAAGAGRPLDLHLVDSDARKCAFLREAARVAGVAVNTHNARIEAVSPFPVHVVTARALAPLDMLLGYAARFAGPDTVCLFPKGTKAEAELTEAAKSWTMDTTRHPSVTEDQGVILEIRGLVRG